MAPSASGDNNRLGHLGGRLGRQRLATASGTPMTRALYKPLGTLVGVLGGVIASTIFKRVWKLMTHQDQAPTPTQQDRSWREILAAAALQGAIFGLVKAAIDRGGAVGFERATGAWPGDKQATPANQLG